LGEQDAEIVGRRIKKVEKTLSHVAVPKELRVDCAAQLLFDSAQTLWETIHMTKANEVLT